MGNKTDSAWFIKITCPKCGCVSSMEIEKLETEPDSLESGSKSKKKTNDSYSYTILLERGKKSC